MAEIKDCCSCIYETRSTFTEPCVSCGADFKNYVAKPKPKRKRKTNYDKIRTMTMHQMAIWLAAMLGVNPFDGTGNDYNKWYDWLKEETDT